MSVSMKPGATQLTVMSAAAELRAPAPRHAGDTGLRGRVVRLPGIADRADHRRDVDDAAVALLHHRRASPRCAGETRP